MSDFPLAPTVMSLDSNVRARFQAGALERLSWRDRFLENQHSVFVSIGSHRQMIILSDIEVGGLYARLMPKGHPKKDLLGGERGDFSLALLSLFEIKPSIEKARVTITIPREIRQLNQAFASNRQAVLVAHEDRFEIWDSESWANHIGTLVERLRKASADDLKRFE